MGHEPHHIDEQNEKEHFFPPHLELKWHIKTCHGFSLGLGPLVSSPHPRRVAGSPRLHLPGHRVCPHSVTLGLLDLLLLLSLPPSSHVLIWGGLFLDLFFPPQGFVFGFLDRGASLLCVEQARLRRGLRPRSPCGPGPHAGGAPHLGFLQAKSWGAEGLGPGPGEPI